MKKVVILLAILLAIPLISSVVVIEKQPQNTYNLGEIVTVPVTVKSPTATSGNFNMDLICKNSNINFYKNGIILGANQEKKIESSLVLAKEIIGVSLGSCYVKAYLGTDSVSTNDFEISNFINVSATFSKIEAKPGENIIIKGKAIKANGQEANGFAELVLIEGNKERVLQQSTVNDGTFALNVTIEKSMAAGAYLFQVKVKEESVSGDTTNEGILGQNVVVRQVPTSVEIVLDKSVIDPGANLKAKAILHDQTGEKIAALAIISIKNAKNKIIIQKEIQTDEFFEYPIAYSEAPSMWKIVAASSKLTADSTFQILEKESADIKIEGNAVTITNTGNVPYNKTTLVKVGNQSVSLDVYLKVEETKRYFIAAPDGEYDISVVSGQTSTGLDNVALTGNVVGVQQEPGKLSNLIASSSIWIFIVIVLIFGVIITFRKVYKKNFFGYIGSKTSKKQDSEDLVELSKDSTIKSRNKAEISMSIKGEKQDVAITALHVKNLKQIQKTEGNAEEIVQKIISQSTNEKAIVYESQDMIFFIFAPSRTKTMNNEPLALRFANKMKDEILEHNKKFKQKINFGIAVNYGTLVSKQDADSWKFMPMGTLTTAVKKIASIANDEVLLAERANDRLRSEAKTTKQHKSGVDVYSLKEMRKTEDHSKFISGFLDRLGKDKKKE